MGKGGQSVKPTKAHDTDDLAMKTFVGGDNEAAEATPDDEHAERHDYYRELVAKQKSGKALTDSERAWMDQAVQAHHAVTKSMYMQNTKSGDRVLPGAAASAFADGYSDGMYPAAAQAIKERKAGMETSGRDKLDAMAVQEFSKASPYQGKAITDRETGRDMLYSGDRGISNEPARVSIPEAALFDSLNRIPQGDVKNTANYLGKLGGGKFVDGMTQGYAKEQLHPTPSVIPMVNGERIEPHKIEHDANGNIIIHLPPDMMPEMSAPVRKDKSINPTGYNKKYTKA